MRWSAARSAKHPEYLFAHTVSSEGTKKLGPILAGNDYLRQRLAPSLRDPDYLLLTDLKKVVEEFARAAQGRLFDFGWGGGALSLPVSRVPRVCAGGRDSRPGDRPSAAAKRGHRGAGRGV